MAATELFVLERFPSCPLLFLPQHSTRPAPEKTAQAWLCPAAIAGTATSAWWGGAKKNFGCRGGIRSRGSIDARRCITYLSIGISAPAFCALIGSNRARETSASSDLRCDCSTSAATNNRAGALRVTALRRCDRHCTTGNNNYRRYNCNPSLSAPRRSSSCRLILDTRLKTRITQRYRSPKNSSRCQYRK